MLSVARERQWREKGIKPFADLTAQRKVTAPHLLEEGHFLDADLRVVQAFIDSISD